MKRLDTENPPIDIGVARRLRKKRRFMEQIREHLAKKAYIESPEYRRSLIRLLPSGENQNHSHLK